MFWLWLGVALALLGIELITVDLLSVWFAISAFITAIIAGIFPMLHWGWQTFIFLVIAVALLLLTRPFVKRFLKRNKRQATNLDLVIGNVGVVEEEIDNDFSMGAVKINGLIWSARTATNEKIEKGTLVIADGIEGNKIIVRKKEK